MRVVFALFLLLCSATVLADDHARLYQSAGWPEQRAAKSPSKPRS